MEQIKKTVEGIFTLVDRIPDDRIVCTVCGDITNRGNPDGYNTAKTFCSKLKEKFVNKDFSFVFCPGNHDISSEKMIFSAFDQFTWNVTNETCFSFATNNVQSTQKDDWQFIIVNSVYHGDKTFGRVDLDYLKRKLRESSCDNKVIVLHHHLIPVQKKDRSTTENSYELLSLAEAFGVKLILHGHQHMNLNIAIGERKCSILGVGSLMADVGTNYSNQFNLIRLSEGLVSSIKSHVYQGDVLNEGTLGGYI